MSKHEERAHAKIEDLPREREELTPEQAEAVEGGIVVVDGMPSSRGNSDDGHRRVGPGDPVPG